MTEENIIIGAGLAGLTTAFELVSRGLPVHVVEAGAEAGHLTSFANGGLLIPSSSHPWNRPGFHRHFFRSIFESDSAVFYRLAAMPAMMPWLARFVRHCSELKHGRAMEASYALAARSMSRMAWIRDLTQFEYHARVQGSLKVCRTLQQLDETAAQAGLLRPFGLRYEVLDRRQTVSLEPALVDISSELQGAVYAPDDESGDSFRFCQGLSQEILKLGGEISLNTEVRRINVGGSIISGVETSRGALPAGNVIVCAGNVTRSMLKPFGTRLAICPVKGYSLTLDCRTAVALPAIPIMDDAMYGGVVTLGNRLRLAGVAEFGGVDLSDNEARSEHLFRLLAGLFPRIAREADRASEVRWAGVRAVSADGLPYIGESTVSGLWVNTGHGSLGFTMAAGSANLLADLIEGRQPAIDPAPYRVSR